MTEKEVPASEQEESSPLERRIIRQMEYYFGDHNLPKDKFLKETIKENEDGWVQMSVMLKFKRLTDISSDAAVILTALKKSTSGLLECEGEGETSRIRRSPNKPLPENTEEANMEVQERTAYAKGYEKENTTFSELLDYYAEHNPAIVNIKYRTYEDKNKTKHFKGSVFLTFRDKESCQKFIEAEKMEYKGAELIRKWQKDYLEEKSKEYQDKKDKKKGGNANKQENGDKENGKSEQLPKGAVLKIEGLGGDITREDIKSMLSEQFQVNVDKPSPDAEKMPDLAFITYERGQEVAKVRFREENFAINLMEKWNKAEKVTVKENTVTGSVLEGEEEDQFLKDSLADLKNMRNRKQGHKRKNFHRDGPGGKRNKASD